MPILQISPREVIPKVVLAMALTLALLLTSCVNVYPTVSPPRGLPSAYSTFGVRCWTRTQPLDQCQWRL